MTELERKEALKVKMQSICRRHENCAPLDEDERYIFMDIEYLNLHETAGRNIREFIDLADNLTEWLLYDFFLVRKFTVLSST